MRLQKAKSEDIVATVLSRKEVGRYYRFYGARHSILQLGYLIDFEVQHEGLFLPRMRSLSHFTFPWIFESSRMMIWQNMLLRLDNHLRDTKEVESFYYETLLETAKRWHLQNPKRLAVEFYVSMLHFEGRLHQSRRCYVCDAPLGKEVALMVGFHLAHPECVYAPALKRSDIDTLFQTHKSLYLDDRDVEMLFTLMMRAF